MHAGTTNEQRLAGYETFIRRRGGKANICIYHITEDGHLNRSFLGLFAGGYIHIPALQERFYVPGTVNHAQNLHSVEHWKIQDKNFSKSFTRKTRKCLRSG